MIRATTLKKKAKAREARVKTFDQDDGIVATIILPPGREYVLEDIKKVIAGSMMMGERPGPEKPQKKEKKEAVLNLGFIANSVAEEFVDCVKEGGLEDAQAMWYLDLIRQMHESNENMAAYNILNSVLHYAGSPAAAMMNDLFDQLHRMSQVSRFFDAFFEHDEIDDFMLELSIHRAGMDDDLPLR